MPRGLPRPNLWYFFRCCLSSPKNSMLLLPFLPSQRHPPPPAPHAGSGAQLRTFWITTPDDHLGRAERSRFCEALCVCNVCVCCQCDWVWSCLEAGVPGTWQAGSGPSDHTVTSSLALLFFLPSVGSEFSAWMPEGSRFLCWHVVSNL